MKANMPFKTQPIRNMKTGMEDTKKRTPRLVNVKSAVRYNSGHSFEIRTRFPASPFVKYWTLLVS